MFLAVLAAVAAATVEVGKPLPAFSLPDLDGKVQTPTTLVGAPTLVNIWASWCRPCLEEMPRLDALQASYPSWHFVGITLDPDPNTARGFVAGKKLKMPTLLDPAGSVFTEFGLIAVPATYVLDAQGIVRHIRIGAVSTETLPDLTKAMKAVASP